MSTLFELTLMSESMNEHKGVGGLMYGSDYGATYGRSGIMWEEGFGDESGVSGMAKRKCNVLYGSIAE